MPHLVGVVSRRGGGWDIQGQSVSTFNIAAQWVYNIHDPL